jgi:tripartite-type tricarboxylate transporter receptor subunit TctC
MPAIRIIAAFAALATASAPAAAQTWPARSLTIVVPLAAGGGPDALARIFAPHLTELLGRQIVVENVPGAGGMTGANRVAKAPPDGYQMVIGNVGTHAQNQTLYKNPLYNSATDFAPVALVAVLPLVLIARKDLPAQTLPEFIAYAKANQAKMQYGSPGAGSAGHLACVLLNAAIGIGATHVPYRSGASTFGAQDLIAGRIDYMCPTLPLALSQIEGNTVKAIAVLTRERAPRLPMLPSAHEQGLADFDAGAWNALFLPRGTPEAIVKKLNDAVVTTMAMPSVQANVQNIGATIVAPERRSPAYLQAFVESEITKWAGPIKASGVSAD